MSKPPPSGAIGTNSLPKSSAMSLVVRPLGHKPDTTTHTIPRTIPQKPACHTNNQTATCFHTALESPEMGRLIH